MSSGASQALTTTALLVTAHAKPTIAGSEDRAAGMLPAPSGGRPNGWSCDSSGAPYRGHWRGFPGEGYPTTSTPRKRFLAFPVGATPIRAAQRWRSARPDRQKDQQKGNRQFVYSKEVIDVVQDPNGFFVRRDLFADTIGNTV